MPCRLTEIDKKNQNTFLFIYLQLPNDPRLRTGPLLSGWGPLVYVEKKSIEKTGKIKDLHLQYHENVKTKVLSLS